MKEKRDRSPKGQKCCCDEESGMSEERERKGMEVSQMEHWKEGRKERKKERKRM
jgi:hypothetical protein